MLRRRVVFARWKLIKRNCQCSAMNVYGRPLSELRVGLHGAASKKLCGRKLVLNGERTKEFVLHRTNIFCVKCSWRLPEARAHYGRLRRRGRRWHSRGCRKSGLLESAERLHQVSAYSCTKQYGLE